MADFEGLIRQALAKQDVGDPDIRAKIYQSSRSALMRMAAAKTNVPAEALLRQERALEQSISRIEAEFNTVLRSNATGGAGARQIPARPNGSAAAVTVHAPGPSSQTEEMRRSRAPLDAAAILPQQPVQPATHAPRHARSAEHHDDKADHVHDFAASYRAKRRTIRLVGIVGMLAIIGLLGWVAYLLISTLAGGNSQEARQNRALQRVSPLNPVGGEGASGSYITLLKADDPSAIVTDGRGRASLVDQNDLQVLRITSLRATGQKSQAAEPMLLELKPGVLQQISGRRVTVEILAKSGGTGPAVFSVECDFGGLGACGRKRFRVGLQPEAVVFSIDLKDAANSGKRAYLAINTDIASSAKLTGQGDMLDIISARLRIVDGG